MSSEVTSQTERAVWARAKVERARELSFQLEASIQEWVSSVPPSPRATIADDRLSFEVRLPEFDGPPFQQWSLILGDGLHNLRAALDTLVWAYVDEAALTTKQAKSISFPICSDIAEWDRVPARCLLTVPLPTVDRIAEVQPMHLQASDRLRNALIVLHDLDIRDKHRLSVRATASPLNIRFENTVEFTDPDAAARNTPPDASVHQPEVRPGALLLTYRANDPIASVDGRVGMHFRVTVPPADGEEPVGVLQLLGALGTYVTQVIEHIANAEQPDPPS